MPWGRIDDSLYDHPKLDKLGRRRMPALGLHLVALSWCNRWLTDGCLPSDRATKLGGRIRDADALVEAGLWERTTDGYRIHDFLTYNDSREDVLARRAADAERKRKGRESGSKNAGRGGDGRYDSAMESGRSPDGVRSESATASTATRPGPSRPVPARPGPSRPDRIPAVAASTEAPETARGRPSLGVVPGMTERSGVVPIADVLGRLSIRSSGDGS